MIAGTRPRGTERWLLILATLLVASGAALLDAATRTAGPPGAPHPHIPSIAWWTAAILGGFWILHLLLCLGRRTGDQLLAPLVCALAGIGWLEVTRLAPEESGRQAIWILAAQAAAAGWVAFAPRYRALERYKYVFLACALALQAAVMIFGISVGGAKLWFHLGPMSFQPVEIIKILLVLFLAAYLQQFRAVMDAPLWSRRGRLGWTYLIPLVIMWGVCLVMLVVQKDLGSALLFFGVFMTLFAVATRRWEVVAAGVALFIAGVVGCTMLFPHVQARMVIWHNPWPQAAGSGFQIIQALYAYGAAGLTGAGLGMGQATAIPAVHTDFIFTGVAEELGLAGALAVLAIYAILVGRCLRAAVAASSDYGRLLGAGLAAILLWQTFINVGGVITLIPLTGITLPFMSYGGSSLVANGWLMALVFLLSEDRREAARP